MKSILQLTLTQAMKTSVISLRNLLHLSQGLTPRDSLLHFSFFPSFLSFSLTGFHIVEPSAGLELMTLRLRSELSSRV